ncbi:flagellar hook assembly protein FlgD [Bacillus massilinigeriensis]|uniref:flagellar hook assembly protein FlgD n=1 Tax=Bacillus mediterraneensis TaxID=1805474 RepID=UPI0008F899D8|nr:flagellar hook assembly protein FlgD [Bacillus mediterraneensis]
MAGAIDTKYLLSSVQERMGTGKSELGKDDFLQLLMTQLQNQDPMNPLQDKDFIAQMATFSSLEQMTNVAKSMENLLQSQEQNKMIAYSHFVGKQVKWHKLEEGEVGSTPALKEGSGKVERIEFTGDSVSFHLEDGTKLEPANISEIGHDTVENTIIQASQLIGRTFTYVDGNGTEKSATVKSVSFKNGKAEFILNNEEGTKIDASQIVQIQ